jgi:hypothetical protein
MAIGVLRAFAAAGVRVPEEVAVVGFDDIYPSSLFDPPLTTVHQPMRMLGERACARVLERIANPALAQTVELLPAELVLRSSCGCPPGTVIRRPVKTLKRPQADPAAGTDSAPQADSAGARADSGPQADPAAQADSPGARTGGRGTRQARPKSPRPSRRAAKA